MKGGRAREICLTEGHPLTESSSPWPEPARQTAERNTHATSIKSAKKSIAEKTSQREGRVTRVTRDESARARYVLQRDMKGPLSPCTHLFGVACIHTKTWRLAVEDAESAHAKQATK